MRKSAWFELVSWLVIFSIYAGPTHVVAAPPTGGSSPGKRHGRPDKGYSSTLGFPDILEAVPSLGDVDFQFHSDSAEGFRFLPTYCALGIAEYAKRAHSFTGDPLRAWADEMAGNTAFPAHYNAQAGVASPIPDVVPLNPALIDAARATLRKLWTVMYGENYEKASPPLPSGPGGELKILLTAVRAKVNGVSDIAVPARLRELLDEGELRLEDRVRTLEATVERLADELELKEKIVYRPEPAIMVSNALGRVGGQSGMGESGQFARPLIGLMNKAFDDYLWTLAFSAETDIGQNQVLLFLASRIVDGGASENLGEPRDQVLALEKDGAHTDLYHLLETLSAATIRDGVLPLPKEAMDALFALTGEYETRFSAGEKEALGNILYRLDENQVRLRASRLSFSKHYEAAILSYYLVHGVARANGRIEQEFSNFLRARMVRELDTRQRLFAVMAAHLLNHQQLTDNATDTVLDLRGLTSEQIINRYLRSREMEDNVASLLLSRDNLDTEYRLFGRLHAREQQYEALRLRVGASRSNRIESRLRASAETTGRRFLSVAAGKLTPAAPILKSVLAVLEADDAAQAAPKGAPVTTRIIGRVMPLPEQLPHYIRAMRLTARPFIAPVTAAQENTPKEPPKEGAKEEEKKPAEPNKPKPETPPRGALVLGDFFDIVRELDAYAIMVFEDDLALQRQRLQPDAQELLRSEEWRRRMRRHQEAQAWVGQMVVNLEQALETAFLEEQRAMPKPATGTTELRPAVSQAQAAADARATLAQFLTLNAPSLARSVVHTNQFVPLRGLQRQLIIRVIRHMLDQPEEFLDGLEGEGGRHGGRLDTVAGSTRGTLWRRLMYGLVIAGSVGTAGYMGWSWYDDKGEQKIEKIEENLPKPVVVDPARNGGSTPPKQP